MKNTWQEQFIKQFVTQWHDSGFTDDPIGYLDETQIKPTMVIKWIEKLLIEEVTEHNKLLVESIQEEAEVRLADYKAVVGRR